MQSARLFIAAGLAAGSLVACGGSSSETPFPVEPDRAELQGPPHRARFSAISEHRKPDASPSPESESMPSSETIAPSGLTPATWGEPSAKPGATGASDAGAY